MTTYYITTYGLTKGILKVEGVLAGGYVLWSDQIGQPQTAVFRQDAFLSESDATITVEQQRMRKIASLRKQHDKLINFVPKVIDMTVKP